MCRIWLEYTLAIGVNCVMVAKANQQYRLHIRSTEDTEMILRSPVCWFNLSRRVLDRMHGLMCE